MANIIQKQTCMANSTPSPLAMHKDSQTITKAKPKIRIIHIFAPEIIKTDVANFRELVQRLTGKPTEKGCKKKPRIARREEPRSVLCDKPVVTKKMELRSGFFGMETRERVKEEEEMWNGANSGGFLNGFTDFDGFIQELGDFPLLPLDSTHMHGFEESQLLA